MSNWFESTHEEYDDWYHRWVYAQDHYEAEVFDKLDKYLQKRKQGESVNAFDERKNISDYLPLQGHVVDQLAGMLFAVEDKGNRQWFDEEADGESLGSPEEEGTVAFTLSRDSDGEGTDWETKWKTFAIDTIVNQKMWVLVNGKRENRPHASVNLINPRDVTDWVEDENGRLVEAKVRDTDYNRGTVKEPADVRECCLVYSLDGWEKHVKIIREVEKPNGQTETIEEIVKTEEGAYHYEDRDGNRILPIYRTELPLRRYIAYILARKNNAIFNKESAKDFLEWTACFPRLNVIGKDELFKKVAGELREGSSLLQNDPDATSQHSYIAPSTEPAQRLADSLKEKIQMFLYVAFQSYSDSAQEKTATEVRQDLSKGIGAFLELLKGTVDEAENNALWRIEQVYFPARRVGFTEDGERTEEDLSGNRDVWGQAQVERSSDFMPIDIEQRIKDMAERFFPMGPVPLNPEAKAQAAAQIADHFNVKAFDVDKVQATIEAQQARSTQGSDFEQEINDIVNGQ